MLELAFGEFADAQATSDRDGDDEQDESCHRVEEYEHFLVSVADQLSFLVFGAHLEQLLSSLLRFARLVSHLKSLEEA